MFSKVETQNFFFFFSSICVQIFKCIDIQFKKKIKISKVENKTKAYRFLDIFLFFFICFLHPFIFICSEQERKNEKKEIEREERKRRKRV
jgi:hypothetical protein